jgi:hypothetical protein
MINLFKREPWKSKESIYQFIIRHIDVDGVYSGDTKLPDDATFTTNGSIGFAPGAMDGVLGHHSVASTENTRLIELLENISKKNSKKSKIEFYNIVRKDGTASIADNIIERASKRSIRITQFLLEWIKILTFESPDRGAVKIGIALLGTTGGKKYLPELIKLGKHEEFTLYVSVAIMRLSDKVELDLWDLAKSVHGWGRIHLVERLANTNDAIIKSWIFLEGYSNSVMNEYLALIAAETGEMSKILSEDIVSDEQLKAASDIISALIAEGPTAGISAYNDASIAVDLYLKQIQVHKKSIDYLVTTIDIYDYLNYEDREWSSLESCGWNIDNISILKIEAKSIIDDESWIYYINENSNTKNNVEFWKLNRAAKKLNIDFRDIHWERLQKQPKNSGCWFDVMESADESNIEAIISFALDTIPFKEKFTGPSLSMGIGDDFQLFNSVNLLLQGLRRFPRRGEAIIFYAIDSPVISNRNGFLNVLKEWGYENLSEEMLNKLRELVLIEPNEKVKERVNEVLEQVVG